MKNGMAVANRLRGNTQSGIPWMTILDSDGAEIVNSDAPTGNIGCPVAKEERAYFVSMLEKSSQHSSADEIEAIAKALGDYAATLR